jgi:hypothetical protein
MKGKNKIKSRKPKRQKAATWGILVDPASTPRVPLERMVESCRSFIPRKLGTGLSCANLTEELDPTMFGNIIECRSPYSGNGHSERNCN